MRWVVFGWVGIDDVRDGGYGFWGLYRFNGGFILWRSVMGG